MEPSYNVQDRHWKGTSYLSLILKTDVGLGRNSLPSYIFFSFSDQILFIAVNRNFSGADGFRRPCQEDGFSLSLLPAPPVLEFPVAEAVNSHIVQRKEAEMETRRRSPRQFSCVAAARDPVWTKHPRGAAATAEATTRIADLQSSPRRSENPKQPSSQSERKTLPKQEQSRHWHFARPNPDASLRSQDGTPPPAPAGPAGGAAHSLPAHMPSSALTSALLTASHVTAPTRLQISLPRPAASWAPRADGLSHAERPTPTHSGVSLPPMPPLDPVSLLGPQFPTLVNTVSSIRPEMSSHFFPFQLQSTFNMILVSGEQRRGSTFTSLTK